MSAGKRIAVAMATLLLSAAFGVLVAGAAGNRSVPKKPQPGAEFLEGNPSTRIKFHWKIPEGLSAQRIEVSGGDDVLEDGSFARTVRSKKLKGDEERIKLGVRSPGRYYWHVATADAAGVKLYGPTATFVVLATLSRGEAKAYTEAVIKSRLEGGFKVRRLDCDRLTKLASHCKFSGHAQGFSFNGTGKTFLKGATPDNFKYYHYRYVVEFVNDACVNDHDGKASKCTDLIRWTA